MKKSFNAMDHSKKTEIKLIIYLLMFVAGLVVAIGAYTKDVNYGPIAQLVTVIGLIITLCAGVLLFPSRHELSKKIEKNKKVILSFLILFSIFSVLLFIYADIAVYRLPGHLIELTEFSNTNPEMQIYFDHFGKRVEFESDGLTLIGTIYGIENETVRPGVVIIHGFTRNAGRKFPLYRILSKKLVDKGYIVLTYDGRGIGESDVPQDIDDIESWNSTIDAINAVSCLCSFKNVNKSRIYVIGHSGGTEAAMYAGNADERIKKIVAIGPIRFHILGNASKIQFFRERFSQDRKLRVLINLTTFLELASKGDNVYNDYFYEGHVPILLMDGELESEEYKQFLRKTFKNITEPKRYITINDTGHYCNTTSIGNFMVYNDKVITETVNAIDDWFSD